ncbi:IPT/TIG domain-containing protein [candidate division KSB1 bacterium]|nr:IPT/TIG domain-containing protein [candidate division KSB1 bacterium]
MTLTRGGPALATLPWSENFETGAPGWVTSGFFNVIADPQLQQVMNPTINPALVTLPDAGTLPSAHGGNHALWYGEASTGTFIGADFYHNQPPLSGGTSQLPNTGWAITPDLDLTSVTDATLSFWTLWEVEGVDIPWYDVMYVEASIDAGATWSAVGSGALNPLNDVNTNANVGYSSGGIGLPPAWVQHSFSLADFCGNACWLRFRFDTVDQLYNGFRGWFIDDISVEGTGQSLGPIITDVIPGAGQPDDIIYVHGQNFQSGATITLGGLNTTSAVLSNVLAQFIVPVLPDGNYDVTLTNPDGQFDVCTACFEITPVQGPQISFVVPNWAYPGIPTPIIIEGQNFDPAATVTIGGQLPTDIVVVTQERITCTTPATLGLGFHAVRVTNPDGQFDQCTGCFEVRIPEPPTEVVINHVLNDIQLNWRPAPWVGAEYRIFRDTELNGTFSLMVGDVRDTFFVDNNVLVDPDVRLFYIVKAYVP